MKAKNVLMIFAMIAMAVMFTACASITDPDDPFLPKDKSISVQYIRQPPIDYNVGDVVHLIWNYSNYSGRASMTRTSEDNFSCGAQIKTETKIGMTVEDLRKYHDYGNVRERLFVDNHEFIFDGPISGGIEFVYHNDGIIELTKY
jgi:hypothetical protein